jgi:hypothetical protein
MIRLLEHDKIARAVAKAIRDAINPAYPISHFEYAADEAIEAMLKTALQVKGNGLLWDHPTHDRTAETAVAITIKTDKWERGK